MIESKTASEISVIFVYIEWTVSQNRYMTLMNMLLKFIPINHVDLKKEDTG
jgi:hypothetical protein